MEDPLVSTNCLKQYSIFFYINFFYIILDAACFLSFLPSLVIIFQSILMYLILIIARYFIPTPFVVTILELEFYEFSVYNPFNFHFHPLLLQIQKVANLLIIVFSLIENQQIKYFLIDIYRRFAFFPLFNCFISNFCYKNYLLLKLQFDVKLSKITIIQDNNIII